MIGRFSLVEHMPIHFNETQKNQKLYDTKRETLQQIWIHFHNLLCIVTDLEQNGVFDKITLVEDPFTDVSAIGDRGD